MPALQQSIRPSPLAGLWYPRDAAVLRTMINDYLSRADITPPSGRIIGLLAPHAGLQYSGPVAAHAFKLVQGLRFDTVAIISPFHRPPPQLYSAAAATTAHDAYETPLGTVPVDHDALEAVNLRFPLARIWHDQEHALEIELPFLQMVLEPGFSLLPIMLIDQTAETAVALGNTLADVLGDRQALLVASSDLSHFFPEEVAHTLDARTLNAVKSFDPQRVVSTGKSLGEGACGRGAVAAVMEAARRLGANAAHILHYATSADTGGDRLQVVGYGAAAFVQQPTP
ncbi:MAG: AmmeMemoRadiSam system protein B [Anaerolineae bacterium]